MAEMLLSLLSAAAAFAAVLALFHRPDWVRRAAEAEAALENAAVRNPRFDEGLTHTIMLPLVAVAHQVNAPELKRRIRRDLIASGRQYLYTSNQWLSLSFLGVIVGALLGPYVQFALSEKAGLLGVFCGAAAGLYAPLYHLRARAAGRLRRIERRLPYALDLVSLSMTAGATFVEAVDSLTRDDPDDPLNEELRAMMTELELGRTRREALLGLSGRIPLESLRTVVTSVVSAEELGTPLADILKVQANLLRMARTHRAEKLAGEAAVKLLVPSMLILLSVVLTILAPFAVRFLRGDLY
ncbi:MAG: type II secretion system F family protein [Phycisphaerae bacterium]|nr:type II secretion system F family protein [Phycisphaerae bacterium]NUQ45934.1 type II secretion system F family protein [Phycisphaerae bacterium]